MKVNNDFASSRIGRKMNLENYEDFSQESPQKCRENFITDKSIDGKSVAEAFAQRFNKKVKKSASNNIITYKHGMKNSHSQSNYKSKNALVTDKYELMQNRKNYVPTLERKNSQERKNFGSKSSFDSFNKYGTHEPTRNYGLNEPTRNYGMNEPFRNHGLKSSHSQRNYISKKGLACTDKHALMKRRKNYGSKSSRNN